MTSPATGFFHLKDNDTPPDRDQWWTAGAHEEGIFGSAGSQLSVPGGSSAPPARVSPRNSLDYSGGSNWFRGISSFTGAAAGNRSQLTASLLVDNEAQRQAGGSSSRGTARQLSRDDSLRRPDDVEEQPLASQEEEQGDEGDASKAAICDGKGVVFGGVNTVVTLPSMVAFANIIFKSPKFAPFMPIIVRLLFLSAGVHQLAFVIWSNVPGAIGQVQDVGLIFLSAMTASIVAYGEARDLPFTETLNTVMLTITGATFIVGVLIILMARFKVASLVQYVPVPVVGGYLAFVGYFCCVAGIALAAAVPLDSLSDWLQLLTAQSAMRLLPMLGTWLALHNTVHHISHPLGLPVVICCIPALFFAVLYLSGTSLQEAQKAGWAPEPVPGGTEPFWAAWEMYGLENFPGNIHWKAVVHQVTPPLRLFQSPMTLGHA
eukprot:jgi/Tetstr1/431769/TSEL_021268.t1